MDCYFDALSCYLRMRHCDERLGSEWRYWWVACDEFSDRRNAAQILAPYLKSILKP